MPLLLLLLLLSGCTAYWSHVHPINTAVADQAQGQDCSPMFFGFGFGTNTMEKAMASGYPKPITTLRSVEVNQNNLLGLFGGHCLIVHGETGPKTVQTDAPKAPSNLASPYYSK